MENKQQLYLIDAMALIFRSYYALNKNPRINSKGFNTSAVLGFANALLDIIKQHSPSHLGVAFDLHETTIRKQNYEDYKANRQAAPEDILASIPYVKRLIEAMNIPYLACPGYEADDVIGTLAKKAEQAGFQTYMVTPDKDYAQLVDENIFMLKLPHMGSGEQIWGIKEVQERFEVKRCEQVIDILGLWGDSSDNIPGVPSIGEKKAKALMQQFNSIEDIIANSSQIENKSIRKAIEENTDKALLSKKLATIMLDCPIDFDSKALQMCQPNIAQCKMLFSELEFQNFEKRFFTMFSQEENAKISTIQSSATKLQGQTTMFDLPQTNALQNDLFSAFVNNINTTPHTYTLIDTQQSLKEIVQRIKNKKEFSFAVLASGEGINCNLICMALSLKSANSYLITQNAFFDLLKPIFEDENITKICAESKEAKHALLNYGICLKGCCFDICVAYYLVDSEARHDIDSLSEVLLDYEMIASEKLFLKGLKVKDFSLKDFNQISLQDWLCQRADMSLQLYPILVRKLTQANMLSLYYDLEMPLTDVLLSMERQGISLDSSELNNYAIELQEEKQKIETQIYAFAQHEFNIASPKQLSGVLYNELQIGEKIKKTSKTKTLSTAEEVLTKLIDQHPIVSLILDYRSLAKLKGTYVDALPLLVNKKTNRLHTTFNQTVASTGRLSSANPNLQNIPIRTQLGRRIRKAFVAQNSEYCIMSADYSQIELRIIASLSQDEHMCKAFSQGMDIHLATAAKINKVSIDEVTKDMRLRAKSVNFGIIYGISAFGLSEQLHIPRKEASDLIDQYFIQYPQIKNFISSCIEFAQHNGYAQTLLGRRRYLYDINSRNVNLRNFAQRNAVNMPIQGTSADMIKQAMISVYKQLQEENLASKMLLQVHDELVLEVLNSEQERVKEIVQNAMTNALPLKNVPVVVEIKTATNWLDAH
jgi:DNA polymerase I